MKNRFYLVLALAALLCLAGWTARAQYSTRPFRDRPGNMRI
jgi:hypothetical protein